MPSGILRACFEGLTYFCLPFETWLRFGEAATVIVAVIFGLLYWAASWNRRLRDRERDDRLRKWQEEKD